MLAVIFIAIVVITHIAFAFGTRPRMMKNGHLHVIQLTSYAEIG